MNNTIVVSLGWIRQVGTVLGLGANDVDEAEDDDESVHCGQMRFSWLT